MTKQVKKAFDNKRSDAEMRIIVNHLDADNRNVVIRKSQSIYNVLCGLVICLQCYLYISLKIELKNEKIINKLKLSEMMNKNDKILITNELENRLRDLMFSKLSSELQALKKGVPVSLQKQIKKVKY